MPQIIQPNSKEHWLEMRSKDVTSTEVSALFGASPYMTEFELWHRKKDKHIVTIEENERMKWGNRLEDAIARGVAEDEDWAVEPMKFYMRDQDLKIGSSFDYTIYINQIDGTKDTGVLEIKNVDALAYRDGWDVDDDGNIEAPPHIELQVQHQLAVSGRSFAYIAALVGGNRVALIKREPDPEIIKSILQKVKDFWQSIEDDNPPKPDFEKDAEFIKELYKKIEPANTIDATDEMNKLAESIKNIESEIKPMQAQADALRSELRTLIGKAEKVKGETFSISAGKVNVKASTRDAYSFRNFRISWRKKK